MKVMLFLILTNNILTLILSDQSQSLHPSSSPPETSSQLVFQFTDKSITQLASITSVTITWLILVFQCFIIPFYNRSENLHKDYWGNGKINSTLASIEVGVLIPALARMFNLAINEQTDRRRRPEAEMEALLQSADFAPDLTIAQDAMSEMDTLEREYRQLKNKTCHLWLTGLANVIFTLVALASYIFVNPNSTVYSWLFYSSIILWTLTLFYSFWGLFSYHRLLSHFNTSLEIKHNESD